jgi:DNA-binding NarL/FixJ family response regulator
VDWNREIRASLSSWRKYQEGLRSLRKRAEQRPAAAAFAFDFAAEELKRRALTDLLYYGVTSPQARYVRGFEGSETQAEEPLQGGPTQSVDEEVGSVLAAMQHTTYNMAKHSMRVAGEGSRAAGQGYYGPAVCEAFLEACEGFPVVFAGVVQEEGGGAPETRRRAAAALTAWVRSGISLSFPRLRAALEVESGVSAAEHLFEVLPGAVVVEWAALERTQPLAVLVTRAASRLEREGGQAGVLHARGKLAVEGPDEERGTEDPELDEFTLREELRAVGRASGLSEREYQALQLALEGHTGRAIAEELGVTEGTVQQVKSRARTKLKRVVDH